MKTHITLYVDIKNVEMLDKRARKLKTSRNGLINLAIDEFLERGKNGTISARTGNSN